MLHNESDLGQNYGLFVQNRVGKSKRSIVGWESVGAQRDSSSVQPVLAGLRHSIESVSVNICSICSISPLTIADGSIGLNRSLSRAWFPLFDFNHMNYSRRVAIWLLALSVQIIQACAYCGRLEMISVWLLFLKLLVGMKILTLCASVASVSALANVCMRTGTKREWCRNSVCCICTVLCSVFKRVVMLHCLHPTFRDWL